MVSFKFIGLVVVHKLHTCNNDLVPNEFCTEMFLGSMSQDMKVWSEIFRIFCKNFIFAE